MDPYLTYIEIITRKYDVPTVKEYESELGFRFEAVKELQNELRKLFRKCYRKWDKHKHTSYRGNAVGDLSVKLL